MKPRFFAIQLFSFILILASCSSKPDLTDVENSLSDRITSESNGNLTLIEFEQTNAVEREVFGQASYTIQFKGKVRVENDCFMYVNKSGTGPFFESFETYDESPEFIPSLMMQAVKCSKGEEVDFVDDVTYVETEEGWIEVEDTSLF